MRVTARQTTQRVVDGEAGPDTRTASIPEGICVEHLPPMRPAVASEARLLPRHHFRRLESQDLAPARGMVTGIGIGVALWAGIVLAVRVLAF
jgi:hypothetical protein